MSESVLSFASSSTFRNTLIARNLAPYQVQGVYTPPAGNVTYEVSPLSNSNVIDSPDTLISTNQGANQLYSLNEYGPEGGFIGKYTIPGAPYPVESNKGPYDPGDTILDLVNEFYIDAAYIQNKYGPESGFKDLYVITDVITSNKMYQPYWDPSIFVPSFYSPYEILTSTNPTGSDGSLSQDSYLAKIGAAQLKGYFEDRIASELEQLTIGSINLDTLSDPFSASLLASGQQPFFIKNWKITVPENPLLAAVSFANRLSGTYFPVSFIPGDYFDENNPEGNVSGALNTANNLTAGALGGILNKFRNPSELFLANTGNGQQSVLFGNLNYNLYRPVYQKNLIQGASQAINNLFNGDNGGGGYYIGSENAEPGLITNPSNEVATDRFGKQQGTLVYGPDELGKLYEGNDGKLNFGLGGKSHHDGDGIDGRFVWTSPKYRPNAGFKVGRGGETFQQDAEFNIVEAQYSQDQSIDVEFKGGSILDNTQRIINAADNVQGAKRLKHVGNAINQVSKVFNDGYKELTKGSRVLSYVNQADGTQAGLEYCRVFQKDTPYYTYADLQKVDGITTSGRRFDYSIFDNTYNLNIAPLRNPGSTNIVDGKVKKYMFSIENLAWRTSDRPGYTYDDLPVCEKGPNGGRIMWFPPYNVKFSDDTKPDFNATSFIGRPEPIYTYKNTSRSGQISWTIIVDNPSMMNTIIEKQMKGASKDRIQSIIDSFYAGCTKYDIYELGIKFNTIPTKDLYTYQQILNNPRLTTEEQVEVLQSIPTNQETTNANDASGADGTEGTTGTGNQQAQNIQYVDADLSNYVGYGFYFENDVPGGPNGTKPGENKEGGTSAYNYDYYYNQYIGLEPTYLQQAPQTVYVGTDQFTKEGIPNFFSTVVTGNFNIIQTDLIQKQLNEILVDKKGKVEIELVGSASAPQKVSYNKKLSERRNDSVKKWFLAQKLKDGKTLQEYQSAGFFKMTLNANGEQLVIPKTKEEAAATTGDTTDISVTNAQGGNVLNASVNCTKNITLVATENPTSGDIQESSKAQWYSIPAMACRRVAIQRIKAEIPKDETPQPSPVPPKPVPTPVPNILTGQTQSIKPEPKITIEQKIKEGISKKILRNLFTECDYFQIIKESDPMIYDSIKDRIKYFSPAFHSMTPEGLNARLTFLQQCMRPGQTIPVIGADGRPKYNDALNTTFGAPPILILRFGDFYHTKIVPTNLGISYDPLHLDINPEGIGVQPMLANISLSFNIIGGMGLKEPVQELQNALSFNYYANTEIYDERATATEDTSKMDQYVVQKITSAFPTVSSQEAANIVNNVQPKKGGSTMGVIASDTDIDYTTLLTSLQDGLQGYFKAYYDAISKINTDYNFGVLQIALQDKSYTEGELSEYTNDKVKTTLYGKSNNYQEYVENLIKEVKKDIEQNDDPILSYLKGENQMTNKIKRELEDKLQAYATQRQQPILDVITNNTSNITKVETDLNYLFRQLDVVSDKLDGYLGSNNEPIGYDLSGDTFFGPATTDGTLANLYTKKVPETITKFEKLLESYKIISKDGFFKKRTSTIENGSGCKFVVNNQGYFGLNGDCPWNRFYIAMSPLFTKEQSYTEFVNDLVSGPEIKNNPTIIDLVKRACNNVKEDYIPFQEIWTKVFTDIEKSQDYVTVTTFKLPDGQVKVCNYKTPITDNTNQKNKKLKDLYSSVNLNDNKKTFNGKVTFN